MKNNEQVSYRGRNYQFRVIDVIDKQYYVLYHGNTVKHIVPPEEVQGVPTANRFFPWQTIRPSRHHQ